jgi:mono/diheme cytochrome c family protein
VGKDERHYNINNLNILFACASLILLSALGWLFVKDYSRPWKKHQQDFRALEVEQTRVKLDSSSSALASNPEYQALQEELTKAREAYNAQCRQNEALQKEIKSLQAHDDSLQQQYRFTKSEFDAARYRLEIAKEHPGAAAYLVKAQKEYADVESKLHKLLVDTQSSADTLKAKNDVNAQCGAQLAELERKERELARQKNFLSRKLENIDPGEMTFVNQMANLIRDLPIIDLANPNNKIKQVVLKDIREDVNFLEVPKVDRCITCHLGIDNPDYANMPQPFRTHPNLELYLGKESTHPLEEFGCTVCHGGRGRGTDFTTAAHTPSSEEQAQEWEKKYRWQEMRLWEEPMLPLAQTEAGCFKCHAGQSTIKGADKLNLGLELIEKAGCYGCHFIEKYKDWPQPGPDLTKIAAKVSKEWAYQWIENPKAFRPDTRMPSFYHLSNNSDPESMIRGEQEIHAIVHYLFQHSEEFPMEKIPSTGDAHRGQDIVESVGCFACHQVGSNPQEGKTTADSLRREHGPNLIGLGRKTTKEWIYHWVKNPPRYHPATRMPNLRLTDQEAADVVEYLASQQTPEFDQQAIPALDPQVVDRITLEFLKKSLSNKAAGEKLAAMTLDEKLLFSGEKLIGSYGCYGCHTIAGFEEMKKPGTELTEEGSKALHNLDFGFVHIDHTKPAWFAQKLHDPRSFDKDKVKIWEEKLKMPNFYFSEQEIDAMTTALLGFVEAKGIQDKIVPRTPENLYIEEGQKIIRQLNCQSCHMIEGEGGTIQESVKQWLIKHDGKSADEAAAIVLSFSPPNLVGEGKKVQPQWLFDFLHQPTTIRPWLKVRMPTYTFNADHLNSLLQYFNALDKEPFPFTDNVDVNLTQEEYLAAEKLFSDEYFDCAKCHIVGDKMPGGSPENWAPNFALAKTRLKPGWILEWMKNPAALLPGTKMPTYFDPENYHESGPPDILNGDEDTQIRVLRNYLNTIAPLTTSQETKKNPEVKEAPETLVAPAVSK